MGKMHFGEHPVLEQEANRLIKESMRGSTSHASKSDILTPWKEQDRRGREVYTQSGVADGALRRGVFGRALSPTHPHLNARDGLVPPPTERARELQRENTFSSSLAEHVVNDHLGE